MNKVKNKSISNYLCFIYWLPLNYCSPTKLVITTVGGKVEQGSIFGCVSVYVTKTMKEVS